MRIKAKETSEWKKALLPSLGIFLVYYLWLKFSAYHYNPVHMLFMNISISFFLQSCVSPSLEVVPPSSCPFSMVFPAAYWIRCKVLQVHTQPQPVFLALPATPSNWHILLTSPSHLKDSYSGSRSESNFPQKISSVPTSLTLEEGEQIFHLLLITRYLSHVFLQLMYVTCGF